ncbi:imidazole glycerol phosphate synthase subunit HisH [Blastomonas aquatica]|uniref:Imidazole glycerol phosphate synthase subunit HisH n=1 Tax=Blastomonas aquatica TaxID=1510276 RepID=A0ABQ1JHJ0_9SPHN|nr:imidazole glycerol phosphate synthase subunit HisH [Blastomonas aquatica]GGB68554.1 imidazole glycerol phosphate synthase subunit HisH [Blastomonas aquatica]
MAERVALIDYGAGNLHSVHNALKAVGAPDIAVTDDPAVVRAADRIILPGVGAFAACMDGLSAIPEMIDALEQRVLRETVPFLGICVGMQLLATRGVEHGVHQGLGWIPGEVRLIEAAPEIKVPHMGWNDVIPATGAPLIAHGEAYFLHSYHFAAADDADVAASTDHGGPVTAAVARGNIIGVQFHPEKSQTYGLGLLRRFLDWIPA